MSLPGTDIWRVGIARAPAARILAQGGFAGVSVGWLPLGERHTFLADPFGLWRDDTLHLFAEAYDYRTRHGVIDVIRLDADLMPIDRRTCLAEPWHLSYPYVFEADGETWMLPEGYKSHALTLYRAVDFPFRWEPAARIALDFPAIDATPFRHDGLWWLAYAPGGTDRAARQARLHLAFADRLTGPWRVHPANPVRIDRSGARPGGSVVTMDGVPVLPVQDCGPTYGAALSPLRLTVLTPDRFEAELGGRIAPDPSFGAFVDGLHTLSACGPVTLIDAKWIDPSPRGRLIDVARVAGLYRNRPIARH